MRAMFAWEIGANYGHIARLLALGVSLKERGHQVCVVAAAAADTARFVSPHGIEVWTLPESKPKFRRRAVTFADVLANTGVLDEPFARARLEAWCAHVASFRPDIMVCDSAPFALLAARATGVPRALLGIGFGSPPRLHPLPAFRVGWRRPPPESIHNETEVCRSLSALLHHIGAPQTLGSLSELFGDTHEDFLCTFAELDHYDRAGGRYWGPVLGLQDGVAPMWPRLDGQRAFVYLSSAYQHVGSLLEHLNRRGVCTVAHIAGASAADCRRLSDTRCWVSEHPMAISALGSGCDVAVGHGHGTIAAALLAGCAVVACPTQAEQLNTATRLSRIGAGRYVHPHAEWDKLKDAVDDVLFAPHFTARACRFAERHAWFDMNAQRERMVLRCEEVATMSGITA